MPKIFATESIQIIFNEFKDKIINSTYYPKTPIETLKSRMTAVAYLESEDPDLVVKAANFIRNTSTTKEEDLQRLKSFASTIKEWKGLEICSVYTNTLGNFLEYKMSFETANGQELLHRLALYNVQDGKCCYVSQS